MNKLTLSLTLLAAALGANSAMANTGGAVWVTGFVDGQTCKISDDTSFHDLTLPSVRTSALSQQGAYSAEQVHFKIELEECEQGITAGVAFDTVNVDFNNVGTLVNLYSGVGAAENVNIQLLRANTPMNLSSQNNSHYITAANSYDTLRYDYAARYYATGKATKGAVTTFATFKIDYK